MNLNVADGGQQISGSGNDVATASLGNKSTTPVNRRRTALHYDSESLTGCVVVSDGVCGETTSGDASTSTLSTCVRSNGHSDDGLPPVSTIFADRPGQNCAVVTKLEPDAVSTTTATTKLAIVPPQISVAQAPAAPRPPAARKRPPRVRKQSKQSRANRTKNQQLQQQQQQQQQQQNGLLIMQKLLGSMASLLRRDVNPLMTSFPVVTRSQTLPLSMFCAGAVGRQMPCGPLARPNLLAPSATSGPLMTGAVLGPVVRPVVWPRMVAGGTATPVPRRAPTTANASTSAPLLTSSRSARRKTSSSTTLEAGDGAAHAAQSTGNRLELLTVAALRDECRRRRLPTGGPKPNLIRRLQQNNVDAASFNSVATSSGAVPGPTSTSSAIVQSSPSQRQLVAPPPAPVVVSSSASKSSPSSPVTTTTTTTATSNDARASLSQSQAIVARILSIRAAQRQRNAQLAAVASSYASSTPAANCSTSSGVVSSLPVNVGLGPPPRAPPPPPPPPPTSVAVTAVTRPMLPVTALPRPNQTANVQRLQSVLNGSAVGSAAPLINGAKSVGQMIALAADKLQQQQQQLAFGQNLGQKSQPGHGHEETWRPKDSGHGQALLIRLPQELGQQAQGQRVEGQNVGRAAESDGDAWRARDARSQVTLCRQQQMLIHELRRQLEQSRRALIEAQAGELNIAAAAGEQPHRLATARPSGDFHTPQAAQQSANGRPKLEISVGTCCSERSPIHGDVISTPTCMAGLSFSLDDPSRLTSTSVASMQQQQQQRTVGDDSLSSHNHQLISPQHDMQFNLHQPTHHASVMLPFLDII